MNSVSLKPFKSKTFYLDLTTFPNSTRLSKDLASLGATEVFSIPAASFVVSDRPCLKAESSPRTPLSGSMCNSPLLKDSVLDSAFSPVLSPNFDKKIPVERCKPMSRGMLLLQSSEKLQKGTKADVIELCKKYKVKIYYIQKVLMFISKYKSKYSASTFSSKEKTSSATVQKITPPFIKIEDVKRKYKPRYKCLASSKVMSSELFRVVKTLVRNTPQSCDVKNIYRTVYEEKSVMVPISRNEPFKIASASVTKPPLYNSISNSVSVNPSKVMKEKENHLNCNVSRKDKKKSKKHYCEICQVHYSDGENHYEKDLHRKFVDNPNNFQEVQNVISSLPTFEDFISKIELANNTEKEACEDEIQLFDGPISMCTNEEGDNSPKQLEDVNNNNNNNVDTCMTEPYTVNANEFISSSCSCPSTPLPYLERRESNVTTEDAKPPSLVYCSIQANNLDAFSSQNVFTNPPDLTPCTSYLEVVPDSCAYTFPNSIENMYSGLNALNYYNENLFLHGTLVSDQEQMHSLLNENNFVKPVVPLDLSLKKEKGTNPDSNDSHSIIDVTTVPDENEIKNAAKICDDSAIIAKISNNNLISDKLKAVSTCNSAIEADQMTGSYLKSHTADDAENFSSESDCDANMNMLIESCIDEVDKNLENDSSTVPNDLNNQHLLSYSNSLNISSTESPINRLPTAIKSVTSSIKRECSPTETSVFCHIEDKSNDLSKSDNLLKYPVMDRSLPTKRRHAQIENSIVDYQPKSKSIELSDICRWNDAVDHPAKKMCFQAENSFIHHQPSDSLVETSHTDGSPDLLVVNTLKENSTSTEVSFLPKTVDSSFGQIALSNLVTLKEPALKLVDSFSPKPLENTHKLADLSTVDDEKAEIQSFSSFQNATIKQHCSNVQFMSNLENYSSEMVQNDVCVNQFENLQSIRKSSSYLKVLRQYMCSDMNSSDVYIVLDETKDTETDGCEFNSSLNEVQNGVSIKSEFSCIENINQVDIENTNNKNKCLSSLQVMNCLSANMITDIDVIKDIPKDKMDSTLSPYILKDLDGNSNVDTNEKNEIKLVDDTVLYQEVESCLIAIKNDVEDILKDEKNDVSDEQNSIEQQKESTVEIGLPANQSSTYIASGKDSKAYCNEMEHSKTDVNENNCGEKIKNISKTGFDLEKTSDKACDADLSETQYTNTDSSKVEPTNKVAHDTDSYGILYCSPPYCVPSEEIAQDEKSETVRKSTVDIKEAITNEVVYDADSFGMLHCSPPYSVSSEEIVQDKKREAAVCKTDPFSSSIIDYTTSEEIDSSMNNSLNLNSQGIEIMYSSSDENISDLSGINHSSNVFPNQQACANSDSSLDTQNNQSVHIVYLS